MAQEQMESETKRREILGLVNTDFEITRGFAQPFGATLLRGGINFSVFSPNARIISLVIFDRCAATSVLEFPLDPVINRTGNVWHIFIKGLDTDIRYGYRAICDKKKSKSNPLCRQDIVLLDPYARATCGGEEWGNPLTIKRKRKQHTFRLSVITDNQFEWDMDRPLQIPLQDTIIYEMHVRGYTRHASSASSAPGTFLGLTEKIPYLKDLGITAVELMPVTDFDETYPGNKNPQSGERLLNFWGYDPISFFALKASYAKNGGMGRQVSEFKSMVKSFHQAGMEVILDMVFNHTGEGNENGPIYHFKALDARVYYLIDPESGKYLNYSGCGNTLNCNHPVVRDMILDSLRYWVTEMHIDGFRFDLASILGRGRDGQVLSNPPLIERIAEDPILAQTKLIAEAWDAAGLYQVGDFPSWKRWMEWNGKFRDDVRRFVRGDEGMVPVIATRIAGSADLYQDDGREPYHSVNFITCHDGFTLHDLVSYNRKHNEANGENNRDGNDFNLSWNCGIEGETDDKEVLDLRSRQVRNFAALLLLSQGVPMLLAGDEFGRTQQGNNNAYCQDNEISWVNWELASENKDLLRFFKELIHFRKQHKNLRRSRFRVEKIKGRPEMSWHGLQVNQPDWSAKSHTLAVLYLAQEQDANDIYILMNMDEKEQLFELPAAGNQRKWHLKFDTGQSAPDDAYETGKEMLVTDQQTLRLKAHSIAVLVSL